MKTRIDTFVFGYCDATRALLEHLAGEAPRRVSSLRVLDPDPIVVRSLRERGLDAHAISPLTVAALRVVGLEDATTVVVFAERVGRWIDQLERMIRTVCPAAQVLVVPAGAGPRSPRVSSGALCVVMSWRFWALVGITVVDALTFMVPLVPFSLVVLALVSRRRLHAAARFFDDLAEAR